MLYSLFLTNKTDIDIYILHKSIKDSEIEDLEVFISNHSNNKAKLLNLKVDDEFSHATTTFYYTPEMYFRLIAYKYLPENLDRILYLDPDILVLNSLEDLYNEDFEGNSFMAAVHTMPTVQPANKARLMVTSEKLDIERYYNSGILMINLDKARKDPYENKIIDYLAHTSKAGLLMPDQDLLNVVFRSDIKEISELKYNYDARRYQTYRVRYNYPMVRLVEETCILHFCGKKKPWLENYSGIFESLYQYMWQRAIRDNE